MTRQRALAVLASSTATPEERIAARRKLSYPAWTVQVDGKHWARGETVDIRPRRVL